MEFKDVVLGNSAKDKVTGFTGVMIGYTKWLNKCVRVALKPATLKDNATIDEEWFDIQQLATVKKRNVLGTEKPAKKATGGPQRDPQF